MARPSTGHTRRAHGGGVAADWCYEAAAPACFGAAVDAWLRSGGADDPVRLFDEAVATLRS